jgi:uncharacterized protein YehS (DUF1456 family)
MNQNEIIKRLRFILDVDDKVLSEYFNLGGCKLSVDNVAAFLKAKTDSAYKECTDEQLSRFLDGLIEYRRGPSKEGLRNPVALNNNVILKKVRIALEIEARDLDNAFMLADAELSPHEISALFRKPGTKHFVECTDEVFEKFFNGLSLYFRS